MYITHSRGRRRKTHQPWKWSVPTSTCLLKASADLSAAERQKDVFPAGALLGDYYTIHLNHWAAFVLSNKKPPRCLVLKKKSDLFSRNRLAGSPSNTTILMGAQALGAWHGNICLG